MFSNEDLKYLRKAILQAGDAIMEIYNASEEAGAVEFEKKSDESPVTAADLAADKVIYDALNARFDGHVIITEERKESHGLNAESFFIVDPLDGTKEFVHRRGDFTVNIGYVHKAVPVFGMVYAPAKGRLFVAHDGKAFEEKAPFDHEYNSEMNQIHVSKADNSALRVVASKSHRDQATDDYIGRYDVADFLSAGSSLKFCLVAAGEADFYPRLGPTMEWDTAAADAVVRAAGGEVLDFESKKPLQYGKAEFRNGFFLVKSPDVTLNS